MQSSKEGWGGIQPSVVAERGKTFDFVQFAPSGCDRYIVTPAMLRCNRELGFLLTINSDGQPPGANRTARGIATNLERPVRRTLGCTNAAKRRLVQHRAYVATKLPCVPVKSPANAEVVALLLSESPFPKDEISCPWRSCEELDALFMTFAHVV